MERPQRAVAFRCSLRKSALREKDGDAGRRAYEARKDDRAGASLGFCRNDGRDDVLNALGEDRGVVFDGHVGHRADLAMLA